MAAISEECSENYSKERYKKEEGKVYHNYTTKFNIMIQVAAVNHLRVIDHANILPVATVYDVAVHGENTIENLNSHYVLTSAEHGQLRQGSYQKILLIRLRDREEYYVMVQHFCVDGSRLPLHLLHTHASILPVGTVYDVAVHGVTNDENLNSHYVLTSAEHGQLSQGSGKRISLIRLRDGEEYYVMVNDFCYRGRRLPLH